MTYNDHRDLMERFLNDQDVRSNTLQKYRNVMRLWINWMILHGISMGIAQKTDFIAFKNEMYARKLSTLTINTYMSVIRRYYRWLDENGEYIDITRNVKGFRLYAGFRKRPLEMDEVISLINSINKDTKHGMRNYLMIRMMLESGMRTVEMQRMDVCDFVRGDRPGIMVLGKGMNEKVFTRIPEDLASQLEVFLQDRNQDEPMWMNQGPHNRGERISVIAIGNMIKAYCRNAGLDKHISSHSLRHTTAMMMIKAGASLYDVQTQLRHQNTDMTRNYLRFYEEENRKTSKITDQIHNVIETELRKTSQTNDLVTI